MPSDVPPYHPHDRRDRTRHYALLDDTGDTGDTGDTITTFDTLAPGELTSEQYYAVVVAQVFRRMITAGPGPF